MHVKLGLLTLACAINLIGFSIVIPLLPAYLQQGLHEFGAAAKNDPRINTYNGLLLSCYAFMQFLFAPLWGRLSDRVGRKPILLASLAGDFVFYAMFGLAQHSVEMQFAARLLAGIFSSGSLAVAQAYIADVTPPEHRAVGLGMIGAAFGIGFVIGPAIGGLLGQYNIGLPLYVASGLALVNAVYIFRYLPESRTPEMRAESVPLAAAAPIGRVAGMLHSLNGPLGFLFVLTFLITFAVASMEGAFTPYIRQFYANDALATRYSGLSFTYIGVLMVLIQGGAIRPLRKRYSEATLILAGIALMVVGFWIWASAHTVGLLLAGPVFAVSVGSALNTPSLRALVSRLSSESVQGSTLGIAASFDSLARGIGPGFGGWLAGHHGLASPYYFSGIIMTIALVWAIVQAPKFVHATASTDVHSPLPASSPETAAPTE